jgi:hypothetical protein
MNNKIKQLCHICEKPLISGKQCISRWFDEKGKDCAAHCSCENATNIDGCCPQCKSKTGVKIIRNGDIYCEDCGWPDENFDE